MTEALGYKGGTLQWVAEIIYGTSVARANVAKINSESITKEQGHMASAGIANIFRDKDDIEKDKTVVSGDVTMDLRYESFELLLKQAMGGLSTVEVATFVVGSTNKYIEFKEDAGSELTATISEATYVMGTRGHYEIDATNNKINFTEDAGTEKTATLSTAEYADAAALAAQIKTQMESAGSGTYTIAFSATTNKFTFTVSGSATTFQFLWKTGTNGSDGTDTSPHDELGFLDTLDGIDAVSDVSDYSTYDPDATLCQELKTQLESAGTGTYTVTFSISTKIVTIAVATGASAVQALWKTGSTYGSDNADTHIGTLLGYDDTADTASAASIVADAAVVSAYTNACKLTDALPTGLSMEVDMDTYSKLIEGAKIESMTFAAEVGGYLTMTLGIVGEDMTYITVTTGNTLSTADLIPFNEITCVYGTTYSITKFEITLKNNLNAERYFLGSLLTSEPLRGSDRYEVTGSVTIDFEDSTEFDNFVAQTAVDVVISATGATLTGSTTDLITITAKNTKLLGAIPNVADVGVIPLEMPFQAYATDTDTRELTVDIVNTIAEV